MESMQNSKDGFARASGNKLVAEQPIDIKLYLNDDQIRRCKEAFDSFDTDRNGFIEIHELESALINMGHRPSEEELYSMMSENNKDGESAINWDRFQQIIALQKKILEEKMRDDLLDTFEALGGSGPDGRLNLNIVKEIILNKFNMKIDVDKMAARADKDGDMTIDFKEFMDIMSG